LELKLLAMTTHYESFNNRRKRNPWLGIVQNNQSYGIYHGANDGGCCTWYELASEVFEITAKNVKLKPVGVDKFPRLAKRPKYGILQNPKLPKQRSWSQALKEYLSNHNS